MRRKLIRGLVPPIIHIDLTFAESACTTQDDHVAHLGPAAAGIGTMPSTKRPSLPRDRPGPAFDHQHPSPRKGAILGWKASAPAHAGKVARSGRSRCAARLTGSDLGEAHEKRTKTRCA